MLRNSYAILFSAALLVTMTACNKSETTKTGSSNEGVTAPNTAPVLTVQQVRIGGDGATLLKKSNCMGCHKMEGKLVGPGFYDVAKKYSGDAGAATKLEAKVTKGGAGVWGTMPMPAMGNVHPEDLKVMIAYILSQTK